MNHNGKLDLNIDYTEGDFPCNDETDPNLADTDGGGVDDLVECEVWDTNPRDLSDDVQDEDGDGIYDYWEEENCIYGLNNNECTDSTLEDTDGDGIDDGTETSNCIYGKNNDQCTDPTLEDTDGDTLLDNDEINNCIYGFDK